MTNVTPSSRLCPVERRLCRAVPTPGMARAGCREGAHTVRYAVGARWIFLGHDRSRVAVGGYSAKTAIRGSGWTVTDESGLLAAEPWQARGLSSDADAELVDRLQAGDADAFAQLVEDWSPLMLRLARMHVSTQASAEEVVQDSWLAVIRGLDRFERRSSLRTWVFRILTNQAKTRGVREARTIPWSSMVSEEQGPTVDPDRFRGPDDQWPGGWTVEGRPTAWEPSPESSAIAGEIRGRLAVAMAELPERQRIVVSLRDVHGLGSDEVCEALGITTANQRVLLHRGRASLRASLEDYYRDAEAEVMV